MERETNMKKYILLMTICIFLCSNFISASGSETSIDEHLEELDRQAQEMVENSTIITSGAFFDTITSIYPDIQIRDYMNRECAIDILSLPYDDTTRNAYAIMWICAQIIADGSFSQNYDSISVSCFTKNKTSVFISVTDYERYGDFETNCFCIAPDDTSEEKAFLSAYNKVFCNFDFQTHSDRELNDIADRFGLSPVKEDVAVSCDYFWLFSSFPLGTIYTFLPDEDKVGINLRDGMSDSRESGEIAWRYINNAALNYKKLIQTVGSDIFTFNTAVVICFDGDSDNRLMELLMVYQGTDRPWDAQVLNYFADDFRKGATGEE